MYRLPKSLSTRKYFRLTLLVSLLVILVSSLISPITQANNQPLPITDSSSKDDSQSTDAQPVGNSGLNQVQEPVTNQPTSAKTDSTKTTVDSEATPQTNQNSSNSSPTTSSNTTTDDLKNPENQTDTSDNDLTNSQQENLNTNPSQLKITTVGEQVTLENIDTNVTYSYPVEPQVTITFTSLDPTVSNPWVSFNRKSLYVDEQLVTGYEIKSNLTNGKFKYNLRLPNPTKSLEAKVKYSEDEAKSFTEIVSRTVGLEFVELKNLDHFTIFVVVNTPNPQPNPGSGIYINEIDFITNDNEWVEIYNSTDVPVNLLNWRLDLHKSPVPSDQSILINTDLIIPPKGFVVIGKGQFGWNNNYLNNDGDLVILRNPSGEIIDQINYSNQNNGGIDLGNFSSGETIARQTDGSSTIVKRSGNSVTKGFSNNINNPNCPGVTIKNTNTNKYFCSIQEAIDDNQTTDGHTIFLGNGNYQVTGTINVNKGLTIVGESQAGVNINMSGIDGYGWNVTASNVTIQNLTVQGTVGGNTARTFKFGPGPNSSVISNGNLSNITVNNSSKTAFDIHGVNNFVGNSLTANNTASGNGLSLSGVNGAVINNFNGSNNAWGDIAIYTSTYVNRGSSNLQINNTGNLVIYGQDSSNSLGNDVNTIAVANRVRYVTPNNPLVYLYIVPLPAPVQIGYNSSSTIPANNRPPQLACGSLTNPVVTNHNQASVLWNWSGNNQLNTDQIKYQRQYRIGTGSWQGNEIYTSQHTNYRNFGSSSGNPGVYGSRVRVFVDLNNNNQLDSGELTSEWSNECYIEFNPNYIMPISLGYNTREQLTAPAQCQVTTSDQTANNNRSSLQIIKWTKVPNAARYQVTGYRLNNNAWEQYGSPYNPAVVAQNYPEVSFDATSDPVVYTTYATNEGIYTYYVEAYDSQNRLIGRSSLISNPQTGNECTFTVDRRATIFWYKVQSEQIFNASQPVLGNLQNSNYPGQVQVYRNQNFVGTIDNTDPSCNTVNVWQNQSNCHLATSLKVSPGNYTLKEINLPYGYQFSWARCMANPYSPNGAIAVWGPDAAAAQANLVYTNGSFGNHVVSLQPGQKVYCIFHNRSFSYPEYPAQTGQLTVIKQDINGNRLPNWQFQVKRPGGRIEQPRVNEPDGSATIALLPGNYRITVQGTYYYGNNLVADANYSRRPDTENWPSQIVVQSDSQKWVDGYRWVVDQDLEIPVNRQANLSLRINDVCATNQTNTCWNTNPTSGLVYWGEFNPQHSYTINYQHPGGPIRFSIRDENYTDNLAGNLVITIEGVEVTGTTGTDGSVTFANLPVGSYSLQEILPNNWEFVSRSDNQSNGGNVTVTTANQTVTFVNRLKPQSNNSGGSGGNSNGNNQTPSGQTGGTNTNTNTTTNLGNPSPNSENINPPTNPSENSDLSPETEPEEPQADNFLRAVDQPRPEILGVAETNRQSDCQNQAFPWWLLVLLILNTLALGGYWWLQKPASESGQKFN